MKDMLDGSSMFDITLGATRRKVGPGGRIMSRAVGKRSIGNKWSW